MEYLGLCCEHVKKNNTLRVDVRKKMSRSTRHANDDDVDNDGECHSEDELSEDLDDTAEADEEDLQQEDEETDEDRQFTQPYPEDEERIRLEEQQGHPLHRQLE